MNIIGFEEHYMLPAIAEANPNILSGRRDSRRPGPTNKLSRR
jgi:hypothetical protein